MQDMTTGNLSVKNKQEKITLTNAQKINLKKNQIRYYNLNGIINNMITNGQRDLMSNKQNSRKVNNNFIELNNSVIIVQNGPGVA